MDEDTADVMIFNRIMTSTIPVIVQRFDRKKLILSNIPMDIKNRPVKLSLKGRISEMA
jgi:hypothetical protein